MNFMIGLNVEQISPLVNNGRILQWHKNNTILTSAILVRFILFRAGVIIPLLLNVIVIDTAKINRAMMLNVSMFPHALRITTMNPHNAIMVRITLPRIPNLSADIF